jgi:hypothetical protein
MKVQRYLRSVADRNTLAAAVRAAREAVRADYDSLNAGAHADRPHLMPFGIKS